MLPRGPAMHSASPRPDRTRIVVAVVALLGIVGLSVWLRWPGFTQGGFASHDVAGILHEAMLIRDGGLPYVDSIELKAPGSFYLGLWLAGDGTDIARFQVWANAWAVATLLVVARVAWRAWGPAAAVVAAGLYALHDAHLDSMDANYVTWAQLPLVAGVGAALLAPRKHSARGQLAAWVMAGVLVGLAALLKRPAGVGVVVALVLAAWPGAAGRVPRGRRVLAVFAGVVLAHVPVGLHYLAHGELAALWSGYVRSEWGMRYVAGGRGSFGLATIQDGMLATVHTVPLCLALAMTACVPPRDAASRRLWLGLVLYGLGTLAAAALGFRFYKGYFLAVSAPLCLLAAAPWGLLGPRSRMPGWLRLILLVPALLLALRQLTVLEHQRTDRARPHDQGGRVIARHIRKDLRPGDRIWVWGWHLWDVYAFTNARSASRVYKSMGLLSQPNDDTWREHGNRLVFADGSAAEILIEDLTANRPVWVVLGSTVPHRPFKALQTLLRAEYERDHAVRIGRVQFWHRKDRAAEQRAAKRRGRGAKGR